jgi:long-chain acyl-CoA synthetase
MGCEQLKKIVFLTGATGFLGTQIANKLIKKDDIILILLIRGKDLTSAYRHLSRAWWEFPDLLSEVEKLKKAESDNKIQILNGDISKEKLGLLDNEYDKLVLKITHIIHAAADLRLNASLEDLRKINVHGTLNILNLAEKANKDHGIERFSYISTAYVAGMQKGPIEEDSLTDEYGFRSNYERSKYEGEVTVKNSNLPITIFRPGMIVGDSNSGYIKTFNTIYVLLRLYLKGQLKVLPVSGRVKINLVPVDYVADVISKLTFDVNTKGITFHLTTPYNCLPTVKQLIDFVNFWAHKYLDLKLPKPIFLPISSLIPTIQKFVIPGNRGLGKTLKELAPYLNEDREFVRNKTDEFMGNYKLQWKKYLPEILKYAVYNGFFHRSTRTVHEQVLYRLKSYNWPINYYDVVNNNFLHSTSRDVRENIFKTINSLKSLGISSGDRVAIVGYNSTRYLILDVAIGLLGAVSVPIYYTSPVNEINEILKDCGAKVIFMGTPQLLDNSHEIKTDNPIISFCSDYISSYPILSWDDFINSGKKSETSKISKHEITAPVDFNDIATIRYTSGTTGKPAGVTFTHGNLRWMAEFIASMPPWNDRTNEISYLSFLPMNHVVEGILGTYSPYYAPASLKIYFLENFQDLEATLPKVRPSIFFSVPRFYEKVWSKIQENWLGNMYLNSNDGVIKDLLRKILKRSILKQMGLDACAQLIVGSAPISEEILKGYQNLGIQIHNAYGLTEAPLVTINRLGSNRIGTVGEPLPCTDVRIKEDGEVIVSGPMVTPGYFNDKSRNDLLFQKNWLLTGDYGHLTSQGSLVITGRKKELIVNSYGKSISPLKIEGIFKLINGISEVMIVGDEKPYCIAMIWVDNDISPEDLFLNIKEANSNLSHPERIKRWLVLKNDLSIECGELTANLKLKRENILKRYNNLIDLIYEDSCKEKLSRDPRVMYYGGEGR